MTDRASRFADHPTYEVPAPGRTEGADLYRPRLRARPPADRVHLVDGADRLDLLAHRYLTDPHLFWRLADANPEAELERLTEPGRRLRVPRRPS